METSLLGTFVALLFLLLLYLSIHNIKYFLELQVWFSLEEICIPEKEKLQYKT